MNKIPYFKGFNRLFGRAKKSDAIRLKDQVDQIRNRAPGQLHSIFEGVVQPEKIAAHDGARDRIYPADVTFWAMLGQAFRNGSLRDGVREVQASSSAQDSSAEVGDSTSSYSDARKRLLQSSVDAVNQRVCENLMPSQELLGGRRIMVVDATSVQLEDTEVNQDAYPQPPNQKEGCGFPVMQLVGLFNLAGATLDKISDSPCNANEGSMFDVDLIKYLHEGDVLLADRAYCSYFHFSDLARRGIDIVMRLHGSRQWPKGVKGDDVRVEWHRPEPSRRPEHIDEQEWLSLPETITVRYVRYRIQRRGFRTREVMLVTTLEDTSVEELAQTYHHRWQIELCFDDIKTTMGIDLVKAKSPEMALKVLTTYLIAYNLIRWLMQQAMRATGVDYRRLSFKGALDSMLRFTTQMCHAPRKMFGTLHQKLFETIVHDVLIERPERFEPRVRKRRPKNYPLMTRPRVVLKAEILSKHQAFNPSI